MGGFLNNLGNSAGSLIGGGLGFLAGGPAGALAGATIGGGMDANAMSANSAAQAQAFSQSQYDTRYQATVADMQAAGLNPMLAYSQGAGTPPTGVSFTAQNPVAGAASAYSAASQPAVNQSQVALNTAATAKTQVDTGLSQAQTAKAWADAGYSTSQMNQVNQALAVNLPAQTVAQVSATIANLAAMTTTQSYLQATQLDQQSMLQAQAKQMLSSTSLNNISIDAAKSLDSIGAKFGQLKPVVDVLSGILNMARH